MIKGGYTSSEKKLVQPLSRLGKRRVLSIISIAVFLEDIADPFVFPFPRYY